jgi:hypothetical protein
MKYTQIIAKCLADVAAVESADNSFCKHFRTASLTLAALKQLKKDTGDGWILKVGNLVESIRPIFEDVWLRGGRCRLRSHGATPAP